MIYAGGYSDMVTQRGHGVKARVANTMDGSKVGKSKKTGERPEAAPRKAKMGFKEKHALETLPAKLEALRADVVRLQAKLDDPALFTRNPEGFKKTLADLEAAQAAIAAGEEQWLTLEMLREEIGG